jgi:hypothetical protein
MIAELSQEERQLFSDIIFTNDNTHALNAVGRIENQEQLIKLKKIYDQKIAFECVSHALLRHTIPSSLPNKKKMPMWMMKLTAHLSLVSWQHFAAASTHSTHKLRQGQ